MVGKVLFIIMLLLGAFTLVIIPHREIASSIFLGILFVTFGAALSIYSKNSNTRFRWLLILLSSLSVISLILYRIILPEIWDDYWKFSEAIFIFACICLGLVSLIMLAQVFIDKESTFKVTADSVIIAIPVILLFWLELNIAKDYIHRSKVDSIDELVYQIESNTHDINQLIGKRSSDDPFNELYSLINKANSELLEKSGGLTMYGTALNANDIRFADEIVVKSGLLSEIGEKIQSISELPEMKKYREELNALIRYRINSGTTGNSVTEMRLRLRLIEQSLKIIEFEVKKAGNNVFYE